MSYRQFKDLLIVIVDQRPPLSREAELVVCRIARKA
jgi:hypothetical protein